MTDVFIHGANSPIHILVIYRPPFSSSHKFAIQQFTSDFSTFLESALLSSGHLFNAGDLNIHADVPKDNDAVRFMDLMHSLGLVQHVSGTTYNKEHTLDLVLAGAADSWLSNISIDWSLPSDHACVHFTTATHQPRPGKVVKQYRCLQAIDKLSSGY